MRLPSNELLYRCLSTDNLKFNKNPSASSQDILLMIQSKTNVGKNIISLVAGNADNLLNKEEEFVSGA